MAILKDDRPVARKLLKADRDLGSHVVKESRLYETGIAHWLYAGDTASASRRSGVPGGNCPTPAGLRGRSKLRAESPTEWPAALRVRRLYQWYDLECETPGEDDSMSAGGRRRCKCAGQKWGYTPSPGRTHSMCRRSALLVRRGCNPTIRNKAGSTPFHLAVQTTGRGGSGAEEAKDGQRSIITEFLSRGVNTRSKDGKGKSVVACANSDWIRDLLAKGPI